MIKVKLTLPNAKAPQRAHPTDAGADLISPIDVVIPANGNQFINLGIILEIPDSNVGLIFPRSGLGSKYGITLRNGTGVIDSKYRGELGGMFKNDSKEDFHIKVGDRIAQIVIVPISTSSFEVVDSIDMTDDRQGGFGSTGI